MRKSLLLTLTLGGGMTVLCALAALVAAIPYLSYHADTGAQILCSLGSSSACAQLQQAATAHGLLLLLMVGSGLCAVLALLVTGIVSLALSVR